MFRAWLRVLPLALVCAAMACAAKPGATTPATPRDAAGAVAAPAELESLEAELAELEAQLQGVGLDTRATRPGVVTTADEDDEAAEAAGAGAGAVASGDRATRCERICNIADATCGLEAKICELADAHAGEPRYGRVCDRARHDCELASESCNACS